MDLKPASPSSARACARCQSPLEPGDLRCAICALIVPAELLAAQPGSAVATLFLRCASCSAAVAYDPRAERAGCAFCGARTVRESAHDPEETCSAYLPFRVDAAAARAAVRRHWSGGGSLRARDLPAAASIESLRAIYWTGWVFDVAALVTWTADSDLGAAQSDWAPHAGQVELAFESVLVPASRGLSDAETRALEPGCDLASAEPEPRLPESSAEPLALPATLERFEVQRSQARARIQAAIAEEALARVRTEHVPGRRSRNVRVETLVRGLRTRRLGFPAWVVAWTYEGKLYRTVVAGQDASIVHGRRPTLIHTRGARLAALAGLVLLAAVLLWALLS